MSYKILVVDDEPMNQDLIEIYLEEQENYELIMASDGLEGWAELQRQGNNIDLILLDRMMPNMSGMELIYKIKEESPELCSIPIIMETASAIEEQIEEGIKAGVYYYLTKPYSEEELLSLAREALKESDNRKSILNEINRQEKCKSLPDPDQWEFSTIADCKKMAVFIACFFPKPERVVSGLQELFVNAVEHGN